MMMMMMMIVASVTATATTTTIATVNQIRFPHHKHHYFGQVNDF